MVIRHGEIWWADLGPPLGSAPALRRPVVVVSADHLNASDLRTVSVAAVTTNLRWAGIPGNVQIRTGTAARAVVLFRTRRAVRGPFDQFPLSSAAPMWSVGDRARNRGRSSARASPPLRHQLPRHSRVLTRLTRNRGPPLFRRRGPPGSARGRTTCEPRGES